VIFGAGLVIGCAGYSSAESSKAASKPLIVTTEEVARAIERGAILWDTRAEKAYAAGHISGAVNIGLALNALREKESEDYIPLDQLLQKLGDAGIDPRRETIVYADRGQPVAYFALVTLHYLGAEEARVYHGGIDDWIAAGKPVTSEAHKLPPVKLSLKPKSGVIVSTDEVVRKLKDPDVQFLDVRTLAEFKGEDIRANRGGHIPGAINIPYEQNWLDPDTYKKLAKGEAKDSSGAALKSRTELSKLYAGLDPDKETIVYCQSGNRSSETAVILQDLGFRRVTTYDSSWLGYAARLGAPAAMETLPKARP
jgi:thiosulfate/3-mercaptopyruvate sulfurtransferase